MVIVGLMLPGPNPNREASGEDGEDVVGVSIRRWRFGFAAQELVHFVETGEVAYEIPIAATG